MRCDDMRELLAHEVLGLLQPAEAARLNRHLEAGCPACAAERASLHEAAGAIPWALPAEEPSHGARARLLETIRKERPRGRASGTIEPSRGAGAGWGRMAASALVGAALAGGAAGTMVVRQQRAMNAYRDTVSGLQSRIERQEEDLASLERQVRDATTSIQMVSAPGISVVDLAGQGDLASASARVFWDARQGTWRLYSANLPPPQAGRTYQLWVITADQKISAGVFDAAAPIPAAGIVEVPEGAQAVAAAITDEPAGGMPQPTGSILLLGKI